MNERILSWLNSTIATSLLMTLLSACGGDSAGSVQRAAFVRTEIVQQRDRQTAVTLTGAIQARSSADLSFRVSGRVLARLVDVGAHVNAGDVLARLDPAEQQADLDAATAAEAAAESQLQVARTNFDRQKTLLAQRFTTQVVLPRARIASASWRTCGQSSIRWSAGPPMCCVRRHRCRSVLYFGSPRRRGSSQRRRRLCSGRSLNGNRLRQGSNASCSRLTRKGIGSACWYG